MSLLTEETCAVILDFRLPPEFHAPADGVNETIVSVKVFNSQSPVNIKDWHRAAIFDAGWKFDFPHHYGDVGVRYQVNVQILHDQIPLLIEQDYFVTVNNTPHRQTLHLSPIGFYMSRLKKPRLLRQKKRSPSVCMKQSLPKLSWCMSNRTNSQSPGFI